MKHEVMKMDKAFSVAHEIKVEHLEKEMLKQDQISCPVIHRFGPGTYIREVHIPAGSLAIGHHQNFEHTNIMLQGRVTILNEDGSITEFKAPMIFTGRPGRKIGFIHEDMVWLNIYPNVENEQNISNLESKYLTKSDNFKLSEEHRNALLFSNKSIDEKDFHLALKELGITKEEVLIQSENTEDMIDLPFGGFKIKIADSPIQGQGVFATADLFTGEIIGPARIGGKRTIMGRFTNHSANCNAKFIPGRNGDINLMAIKKIYGCRGGFDGDEITVDYREAVKLNLEIAGGLKCLE